MTLVALAHALQPLRRQVAPKVRSASVSIAKASRTRGIVKMCILLAENDRPAHVESRVVR